jgi:DNA-directed RNA polymerase
VLESLDVSFKQTQMCRAWLAQICRIVWECQPADLRKALSWTTPLGLIVRQPYSAKQETHLFTPQGYTKIDEGLVKPAGPKQLSALAPNLIHSLDATHMAMTAIELNKRDVSMMAVHDSYWTHACDLPILADTLRRQFVDLYDRYDPLWEIKEQWEELFFFDLKRHGVKLPDPPKRGDLDLKQVINSQYFFS